MFETSFFASPTTLILGVATGLVFGFLLQKAWVTRVDVIVGQFLLEDFTVLKVIGTAIVVGGAGIYSMAQLGLIDGLHVKAAQLVANAVGGLIFGVGMAILGYCPGTGVAAIGDGSRDAVAGVIGMLFGAALYAEVYPWAKVHILSLADVGQETLVTATGLSPWWFIAALTILAVLGFKALETWEHRRAA
jgi:uncharacterized protein